MSRRNFLVLLLTIVVSFACYMRRETPFARYTSEGVAAIQKGALDTVPSRELFDGAMRGMVDVLHKHGDEHSQFLNEAEAIPLRTEIHQQFGGIGIRITMRGEERRITISAPPDPGSPAARAKLQSGDVILAIDNRSTEGMNKEEAARLLRGDPGTTVRLSIQQPMEAQPRSVELVRELINIESVLGDRRSDEGAWIFQLADDPRIAQIRIVTFGDHTAAEFANIMKSSLANGAQAIVIDLRDNPGGSLDAAVAICQMVLPADKTIVETRGRGDALLRRYETTSDGPYVDIPIAVIVNQYSASAAEIVAACLQDHGRASIVGQRSYGKGTVQQLLPLESGKSLLKLTWAGFRRPSGTNIHRAAGAPEDAKWGVLPDAGHELALPKKEYETYRKYRASRDGIEPGDNPIDTEEKEAPGIAGFVDRPLQLAAKYLQSRLGTVK